MAHSYDVTDACPVCSSPMVVARLECDHCGSALEGSFHVMAAAEMADRREGTTGPLGRRDDARFGRLARLDAAQVEFVETFLRCRGIIKNVEDMLGISYPTVKARLADVLETMGFAADEDIPAAARRRTQRRKILADLAEGRIGTEEAHTLLLDLQTPPEGAEGTQDDEPE